MHLLGTLRNIFIQARWLSHIWRTKTNTHSIGTLTIKVRFIDQVNPRTFLAVQGMGADCWISTWWVDNPGWLINYQTNKDHAKGIPNRRHRVERHQYPGKSTMHNLLRPQSNLLPPLPPLNKSLNLTPRGSPSGRVGMGNENGWSQIESLAKMASLKNKLINDQIWHVNLLFLADPNLTNEINTHSIGTLTIKVRFIDQVNPRTFLAVQGMGADCWISTWWVDNPGWLINYQTNKDHAKGIPNRRHRVERHQYPGKSTMHNLLRPQSNLLPPRPERS